MATSPIYNWPEPDNTDLVKNGALAIRTLGNAIDTTMGTMVAKTIVDAKGDLIAGTAADTVNRLAVGANGETLVADSSTSTGLRYKEDYAAGKNAVINGAFNVWQRGTTFTGPAIFAYTADRWQTVVNGTPTGLVVSQQAFTAGTAPVAGYEGTYFLRQVTTGQTGGSVQALATRLEDVRLFANETVTLSFWAKADASRTWTSRLIQSFGSGGSGDVTTSGGSLSVTTSWTRFTQTFTVPSIAGKTIGAGSYLYVIIDGPINTAQTMDIWGVQVEAGSVATAFQTATGTIQGELAACQRYYTRTSLAAFGPLGIAHTQSTTAGRVYSQYPVTMRTAPSFAYGGTITLGTGSFSSLTGDRYTTTAAMLALGGSSFVAGGANFLYDSGSGTAYFEFSAEL